MNAMLMRQLMRHLIAQLQFAVDNNGGKTTLNHLDLDIMRTCLRDAENFRKYAEEQSNNFRS